MNFLNITNRKAFGFSISILNTILFLILLLFPTPFIKPIKISVLAIIILIFLLMIAKKQKLFAYLIGSNVPQCDKQILYKQNLDIMNRFVKLKDFEVHNLEAEISIRNKLYKQLFDVAPDAFAIFNADTILYHNDAFTKLLGIDVPTNFSPHDIWDFIHPNSLSTVKETYNDFLTKTIDVSIMDIKILSMNNITKKVRISSTITFFEDTYYIFSSCHDLSIHFEQERVKMELEDKVANEKLKVECFANISHDIKTPINVIYSAVQLQDVCARSNDYDKVLVYNNVIKQNCLRLQKLLNDVLDITKIDANHFKPKLELCNIICNIEHITESIISYLEHNDISIIFDTNVEEKIVMTDFALIERIMLNLISNAIKYGKQGGHVWVTLHDEGGHLILSVKDDGIGIPKDQIINIFKRFHKTNQKKTNATSSNGIGLSLVKSMVKRLGGDIFCLSTEGVGSEFVLILPMESEQKDGHNYCEEYAASLDLNSNLNIELSDI